MPSGNPEKNSLRHRTQRSWQNARLFVLIFVAAGLIGAGAFQLLRAQSSTAGTSDPPQPETVLIEDAAEPDERKADLSSFTVPADQPKFIHLPSLGVQGPIQKVGLNKNNAITAPSNVGFAGWYVGSVKPGEAGLSIIDGHVSGKYADGVFKNLHKLRTGDAFSVEYGDGTLRSFKVMEQKQLKESEAAAVLLTHNPSVTHQLNIITCAGTFDKQLQTYEDRVIVSARLVE